MTSNLASWNNAFSLAQIFSAEKSRHRAASSLLQNLTGLYSSQAWLSSEAQPEKCLLPKSIRAVGRNYLPVVVWWRSLFLCFMVPQIKSRSHTGNTYFYHWSLLPDYDHSLLSDSVKPWSILLLLHVTLSASFRIWQLTCKTARRVFFSIKFRWIQIAM